MKRPKYIDKPIFEKIAKLVIELYKIHQAGGLLHAVLDDGNFEDEHILWSLENIDSDSGREITDKEKELYRELCNLMLKLTYHQRFYIWAKVYELQQAKGEER